MLRKCENPFPCCPLVPRPKSQYEPYTFPNTPTHYLKMSINIISDIFLKDFLIHNKNKVLMDKYTFFQSFCMNVKLYTTVLSFKAGFLRVKRQKSNFEQLCFPLVQRCNGLLPDQVIGKYGWNGLTPLPTCSESVTALSSWKRWTI